MNQNTPSHFAGETNEIHSGDPLPKVTVTVKAWQREGVFPGAYPGVAREPEQAGRLASLGNVNSRPRELDRSAQFRKTGVFGTIKTVDPAIG